MDSQQPNLRIYHGANQHDIFVESGSEVKLKDILKSYAPLDHAKFIICKYRNSTFVEHTISEIKNNTVDSYIRDDKRFWTVVIVDPETEKNKTNAVVSYKLEFSY